MTIRGEKIYKAAERIQAYGVKAFVEMLGAAAREKRGGRKRLIEYYRTKYPTAPYEIAPKAPYISRSQKSYWRDVKSLAEERNIPIKESRKLLKKLKTAKNVRVRIIKKGEAWQLVMSGIYERQKNTEGEKLKLPFIRREATGHSYKHYDEDFHECYDEAVNECIREAQAVLGGTGWVLIKILKETWIRYYGREQ